MTTAQFCILAAIVLYLVVTILIGVYFSRQGSGDSSDQFYLGGRKLGPLVTAMSAEASDMSSYLLMGLPGLAYLCGVAEVGWTVIGLAAGAALMAVLTAGGMKKASANIAISYAGLAGAFTNTLFVMSGIFILYKDDYANAMGVAGDAVLDVIMGVVAFNGVVEAVVAAVIVTGVGLALTRVKPLYANKGHEAEDATLLAARKI